MSSAVTVDVDGFEFDDYGLGQAKAYVWDDKVYVGTGDYVGGSNGVHMTPEDAVRFGFHLAGLGAKALRAQR